MNRMKWHGDTVRRKIEHKVPIIMNRIRESIADKMRRIVPVKTGALRRSITVVDKGIEVRKEYAIAVELGSAKVAAQPFARPSIEQFNRNDLKKSLI